MQEHAHTAAPHSEAAPAETLLHMITGAWVSQAIHVAAKLGIADLVKQSPKTSADLARATGTQASALYRVLRALASAGVFEQDEHGRFHSTPLAACLQTDAPDSLRAIAVMFGEEWHCRVWADIMHSVQTGQSAMKHVFGLNDIFEYFVQHPQDARTFDQAMTSFSAMENPAILQAYDFSRFDVVVDVAGVQGALLAAVLKKHRNLNGILFDLPHVIQGAENYLDTQGIASRCTLVAGDFFQAVPEGGDLYLFKHIIHDWDDGDGVRILKNCHRAMPRHGKLLLAETVIALGNQPSPGKLLDLEMLLCPGGKERTEEEFRQLFQNAGFHLTRIIPTPSPLISLIEGEKR